MKTKLFTLALASAFFFNVEIVTGQQTGVWTKTINWGSGTRKEVFNVPASYNPAKKYKLIVALHGLGGNPTSYMTFFGPMTSGVQENSQVVCSSTLYPCTSPVFDNFIIACPQATGTNTDFWTPVGDTALITKIIQDAMSMYNIDPEYIYLNGLSLGGRSALRYGLLNYKRFRGIQLWVPAIQSMNEANNLASFKYDYQNAKHIPVVVMVAAQDGQFPQQNQTYRQLYNAGGLVTLQSLYDFCHAPSPDPWTFNAIEFIDKNACSFKNNDAGIYKITSPITNICNGNFTPKFVLQNKGNGTLTSATINYQVDGGTVQTISWTGSLAQLCRANVSLPALSLTPGAHTLKIYTSNPNGTTDAVPGNDALTVNFNVISAGSVTSLNEGFEGQTQKLTGIFQTDWRSPQGWRTTGTDSSYFWELDSINIGGFGQSAMCIRFNNAGLYPNQPSPFNAQKRSSLVTPDLDLSAATAPVLTYDYAYAPILNGSTLHTDTLGIKYSDDCGATWKYLLKKGGTALNTQGNTSWGSKTTGTFFGPTSSQWKTETISLSSLVGKPEILIAFENISNNGNFMYLDNIKLTGATALDELNAGNSVQVFPNPSNGNFTVVTSANDAQIEVVNMMGKKVIGMLSSGSGVAVDISDRPSGVYFVTVTSADGVVVKKVVKE